MVTPLGIEGVATVNTPSMPAFRPLTPTADRAYDHLVAANSATGIDSLNHKRTRRYINSVFLCPRYGGPCGRPRGLPVLVAGLSTRAACHHLPIDSGGGGSLHHTRTPS